MTKLKFKAQPKKKLTNERLTKGNIQLGFKIADIGTDNNILGSKFTISVNK
jgi:hypothetical protein